MINAIGSAIPNIAVQPDSLVSGVPGASGPGSNFTDVFQAAVGGVDSLQNGADQQIASLLQGAPNADIGKTMVSVEKADVAFQLMMQVRNKVVSAYQEMEKMQF
jgi:flagellar hook-basal body complex protein FliE